MQRNTELPEAHDRDHAKPSLVPWVSVVITVVMTTICALLVYVMVVGHESDVKRTSLDARNISAAIGQDVARNLEIYGLSIQGAVEGVVNPKVMAFPKDVRQLILFDRAASATDLGKLMIMDEHGDVVADSTTLDPQRINYSDRDYFKVQQANPSYGLYVSEPLVSRSTGHRIVSLSRRYDKPDGTFGGVVVGTVHLDYFRKIFKQVQLPAGTNITLYRDDGTVLMREPYDSSVGKLMRPAQLFDRMGELNDGEYQDMVPADGVDRLFHFQHVGAFPMLLNVGVSTVDIQAKWLRSTVAVVAVVVADVVLLGLMNLLLVRESKQRTMAEMQLRKVVETDALTGIANRRCLDKTLESEWVRAMRQGQPVSLLMVDADHFKTYNDTMGHGAGDDALKGLAGCLADAARRTGDLAARYGGEEFAIVLPNTDAAGAAAVARKLRDGLVALGIEHPASPLGRFTVSVGIATMVPNATRTVASLVAAADGALYKSKKDGRDRATAHVEQVLKLHMAA